MQMLKDVKSGLFANFRESLRWASVQMMAAWGVVWVVYAQLPPDVMVQMAQLKFGWFNVPTWMGILQAAMTYLARVKAPKGGT
jgi:hypothetical protein